jgi:hypothetical protein
MKTPAMYIAIPFGDMIEAIRDNGATQPRINDIEDEYCNNLGQFGRISIYTSQMDAKKYEPEIQQVVRQWQAAGFIPTNPHDKYELFFLYDDH